MEWVVNATPGRFTSGKEIRYPFYRRMSGPQSQYGWVLKISPPLPLEFHSLIVLPVASRYTDCAIPARVVSEYLLGKMWEEAVEA